LPDSMNMKEGVEFRNALRAQEYFLANDERCSAELVDALVLIFTEIARGLPEIKSEGRELFAVPLVHLFNDLYALSQHIIAVSAQQTCVDTGLFTELNKRFYENLCEVSHFGRLFISLVLRAIMERAAIPEADRKPAFLIVDEAAEYFDQNINDLLTQVRKYKMGCVFAHQFMDQCTLSLKSSLAANTAIKLASRVSTGDARALAPDMRTTPEFILAQPKLQFACYIRDVTSHAISVPVGAGKLEREPQMTDGAYHLFREQNRKRVSTPPSVPQAAGTPREPAAPEPTAPPKSTPPDPFNVDLV
jgi:hypothetical protein